ncbi:MAG: hypothetical protein ACAI44_01935 [Candidatus Sericytochromatia bacterium]
MELPEEIDALVTRKIQEAEADLQETRMQIRWGSAQVRLIKKAAQLMGVPYQTYAKQVLFRQALEDIERIQALGR